MEFWGVEVKAGQPLKVKPNFDNIIHLSQASLGESKKEKGRESVPIFVKFGDQKLVLGTLITENIPQLSFDLVFEKEFELSHNWNNGSIYFCGYQTPLFQDSGDELEMDDSEDEEMELPSFPVENGKAALSAQKANTIATKAEDTKPEKPSKDVKLEEDDDSESDDEDDSDDEMLGGDDSDEISGEQGDSDEDEEDSDDNEDSDEDEETPKKPVAGKKRPTESATKTPVPSKKAKTPMTDGKKGGHVATPHPSKQVARTPNDKMQTPKSGGQHMCKSCSKSFGSENALQSHTKAKHGGK